MLPEACMRPNSQASSFADAPVLLISFICLLLPLVPSAVRITPKNLQTQTAHLYFCWTTVQKSCTHGCLTWAKMRTVNQMRSRLQAFRRRSGLALFECTVTLHLCPPSHPLSLKYPQVLHHSPTCVASCFNYLASSCTPLMTLSMNIYKASCD